MQIFVLVGDSQPFVVSIRLKMLMLKHGSVFLSYVTERIERGVLPVFEPVTEGVDTLSQGGCLHFLLLLLVIVISGHRGELFHCGGRGDDHSVGTLSCQQIQADPKQAVQELYPNI